MLYNICKNCKRNRKRLRFRLREKLCKKLTISVKECLFFYVLTLYLLRKVLVTIYC